MVELVQSCKRGGGGREDDDVKRLVPKNNFHLDLEFRRHDSAESQNVHARERNKNIFFHPFPFFKEASARTQKRHFLSIVARQLFSRKRFSQIWLWRIHLPQRRTFLIGLEVTLMSRSAAVQIFHLGRCSFPITIQFIYFLIQSKRPKENFHFFFVTRRG